MLLMRLRCSFCERPDFRKPWGVVVCEDLDEYRVPEREEHLGNGSACCDGFANEADLGLADAAAEADAERMKVA